MSEKETRVSRKSKRNDSEQNTNNESNIENFQGGRRRKRKKKSKFLIVMLVLFFMVVLGTAGAYAYLQSFSNKAVDFGKQNTNENGSKVDKATEEIKDSVNFLVVGVDNGEGDESNKNDPRRTDTMMVVHYNSKEKKYDVISIPRDTKINTTRADKKINSAHAYGGIPLAVKTVEELLNIKIDHYVKIDTIAFREFIDTIGGIEVIVERNMNYDDPTQNLHIHLNKSDTAQKLNGQQAEGFIRWRKNNDGTGYVDGDLGRIKHMQNFFSGLVDKIQSPFIIPKIPSILSIFPKYVETDLNANDILKYAMSVAGTPKDKINFHTLAGEDKYIDDISYYLYDKSKNSEIDAILREKNTISAGGNIDTANIRVKILNGTAKTGLASDFGEYIKTLGFTRYDVGDAARSQASKIIVYGLDKETGENIKKQFGITNLEFSTKYNDFYEVEVILGEDRDFIKPQKR